MRVDRPPPGEELNPGEVSEARQAASLILLRDGSEGPEVLLVERNPAQRFMGGAWVFPGGAKHDEDSDHAATARRELREEADVDLPVEADLVPFSRWVTPTEVKVRFDTWFFAAQAPPGTQATADGSECVDARWLRPAEALAAHGRDQLMLVFPTIKHLELLAEGNSTAAVLSAARQRPVMPIMPKVVVRDGAAEVLLPGEPGYEDA